MNVINYMNLGMGLFFILMAWLVYCFPNLISPYGNLRPERKALVDIDGLKRAMAVIFGICADILMLVSLLGFCSLVDEVVSINAIVVVVLGMIIPLLIVMRKYNAYGRGLTNPTDQGKSRRIRMVTVFGVGSFVVVFVLTIFYLNRPVKIAVDDNGLKISGMYGRTVEYSDVKSLTVLDEMPLMKLRLNGTSTSRVNMGRFLSADDERCLLFITNNGGPYLELQTENGLIYMNCATPEATQNLMNELSLKLDNELIK